MEHVKFTQMKDGDKEDYTFLTEHEIEYTKGTADRLLKALVSMDEGLSGYQITRLGHSVQSATRAYRDGADIDWIVSAFVRHQDIFAPYNHDEYAATILKPFVREQCTWVVEKHGDFQMIYYGDHVGGNPNKRDAYKDHPYFEIVSNFANAGTNRFFDPTYDSKPIEFFADMVREVFARTPYDQRLYGQASANLSLRNANRHRDGKFSPQHPFPFTCNGINPTAETV